MRSDFRNRFMPTFKKTSLHVVSAVLILLGLYATAGLGYAAWVHSDDSVVVWTVIAVSAFIAAFAWQAWIAKKRRRTP